METIKIGTTYVTPMTAEKRTQIAKHRAIEAQIANLASRKFQREYREKAEAEYAALTPAQRRAEFERNRDSDF